MLDSLGSPKYLYAHPLRTAELTPTMALLSWLTDTRQWAHNTLKIEKSQVDQVALKAIP